METLYIKLVIDVHFDIYIISANDVEWIIHISPFSVSSLFSTVIVCLALLQSLRNPISAPLFPARKGRGMKRGQPASRSHNGHRRRTDQSRRTCPRTNRKTVWKGVDCPARVPGSADAHCGYLHWIHQL